MSVVVIGIPWSVPRAVFVLVLVALTSACADKAEPDFKRCEQLQAEKKLEEAKKACELAVSKDPESKSGKLAQARLPLLATESQSAAREQAARVGALASRQQDAAERVKKLKAQYEDASAREAALRGQLDRASTAAERQRIQGQIDQAVAARDAAAKAAIGQKPGSKCPPGDPLCGDL